MMLDEFLGNESTILNLKNALNADKFLHSVLICGEDGTGVNFLARLLAADFLYGKSSGEEAQNGKQQVMQNKSPEYIVVTGTGASGDIPVEMIRSVRKNVFGTALSASGRVVHIEQAQNLNSFSANALLKVLEEPPANVLFILTARTQSAIMPTLRSRCAYYGVTGVKDKVCADYLQKTYKDITGIKQKSTEFADIFAGKIGLCIFCLTSEEGETLFNMAKSIKNALYNDDKYTALTTLAKYEKEKATAQKLLEILAQICGADLRKNSSEVTRAQMQIAIQIIKSCAKTKRLLQRNVGAKIALTCFVQYAVT